MRLTFTKGPAKYDWLDIVRGDGSAAPRIDCPKQGIIPHDMVHYAVESVLAARGFLGGIAEGAAATYETGDAHAEAVERLVETIQAETKGAVEAIAQISSIIGEMSSYQMTIASAVEEQTATTNEMNRSVNQAAVGSNEIATTIGAVASADVPLHDIDSSRMLSGRPVGDSRSDRRDKSPVARS